MIWTGTIDEAFLAKLLATPSEDLVLCTEGGDLDIMGAAVDHLRTHPRKIIATGRCFSAGVPILAMGAKRHATRLTSFLVHPTGMEIVEHRRWTAAKIEHELEELRRLDELMFGILEGRTKLNRHAWEALINGREYQFDAEAARDIGLIQKIV